MSSSDQKPKGSAELRAPLEPRLVEAIQPTAGSDCPALNMGERGLGERSIAQSLSKDSAGTYSSLDAAETDQVELAGTGTVARVEMANLLLKQQTEVVWYFRTGSPLSKICLISTRSQELTMAARQGTMRKDSCYLIASASLRIASLRSGDLEVLILAASLRKWYVSRYGRSLPWESELQSFFLQHTWPGNLAELDLWMKTCALLGDSDFSLAVLRAAVPRHAEKGGGAVAGYC